MIGINQARRRKITQEEADYGDNTFLSINDARVRYKETTFQKKHKEKRMEEREKAVSSFFKNISPNKPTALKRKATRGIYRSPFQR